MAKIKLAMDTDVDFRLSAEIEAFGYETELSFRFGRVRGRGGQAELPAPGIVELAPDQFEEVELAGEDEA